MENASKALLIAGGALFAILTLTLIVYLSKNITSFSETQDQVEAQEQREAFNKGYEAYNKKLMYGTEVITVINKAAENNLKYTREPYYNINIIAKAEDGTIINAATIMEKHKTCIFECSEISYDRNNARVKSMTFEEIEHGTNNQP